MAIYSRFGCTLEIVGYCGKHKVKGFNHPMMLVRAKRQDDGAIRHYAVHSLRADDGVNEIDAAVDAAPEVTLSPAELAKAIDEAS